MPILIGVWLDNRYGWGPRGMAVGAVVGLVGAFATPALVSTEDPSLPGLFAYLLVVVAAAMAAVRATACGWLGWSATVAGAPRRAR